MLQMDMLDHQKPKTENIRGFKFTKHLYHIQLNKVNSLYQTLSDQGLAVS